MRRSVVITLAFGMSGWLAACGGGSDTAAPASPPCDVNARTCYVGPDGSDTNTGADAANALRSISRAAQLAFDNYTIVVAPGTYTGDIKPRVTGNAQQGLRFTAQELQDPVIVDIGSGTAGFSFGGAGGVVIDGFTIIGGSDAGIVLKSGSDNAEIRNCTVFSSRGDGIRVQDSANVLVFNNLVYRNTGIGVRVGGNGAGSPNAQLINNTVYGNGARGVEIGTSQKASPGAFVFNNIIQNNSATLESIKVEDNPNSELRYSGDFDLVFPNRYIPTSIEGTHDQHIDAQFVSPDAANPQLANFRVLSGSKAIDNGSPLTGQAPDLLDTLRSRTTTGDGLDRAQLDIGYHYLP